MTKTTTPSVLAFEKKLVPSDGWMYGTIWEKRKQIDAVPLKLIEKSVRGTISNRLKANIESDPAKLNAEVEKANLQLVDNCALEKDHDTIKMQFTLKILSGVEYPCACNESNFNNSYYQAARKYIEKDGFKELGKRYATNIANARFLWRNRVGAEHIEVEAKILNEEIQKSFIFDAFKVSIQDFDFEHKNEEQEKIIELSTHIARALSGESEFLLIEVTTYAKIGRSQDVYPSQELVFDKNNKNSNSKTKILYSIGEERIAGMHSQKIGNALRVIDNWYPEFNDAIGPIAVESYGSVTNLGKAYRSPKTESDFYSLFDSWAVGTQQQDIQQEHYIMAMLIRGGVFGKSADSKKK